VSYLVNGVIDTADKKKSDLEVKYLSEYESIYETALTCGSLVQIELMMKKPEVENLVTGSL
jgi:hypothetical protein